MINRNSNKYLNPIVIAEIGCNHQGSLKKAKILIEAAAAAGAKYAKFQKRNNKYLLKKDYDKPHPDQNNSFGKSYGKHRDYLELSISDHKYLSKFCKKNNIKYATSVWEVESAKEIIKSGIKMDYIKIPSACNLDYDLLYYLIKKFKKKIHISTGMTSENEIRKIIKFFKKYKRNNDLVLYVCTSSYPCDFKNLNLLDIAIFKKKFGKQVSEIAFSGHHLGISSDICAYTLGARYIERHFTIDRSWKGTDQSASLEPVGLTKLIRDLKVVHTSLNSKMGKVLKSELAQRKKLKLNTSLTKVI